MSDEFNMTMRKFLKKVGVTSQNAIEEAMRAAGPDATAGKSFAVKAVISIEDLGLVHEVGGEIAGDG